MTSLININNSELNVFGNAMAELFNATKERISKKEWSALLGVSESSLSQWANGKTFPAPDNLRTILLIYDEYDLEGAEQKAFDKFVSLLELSMADVWNKASSKDKLKKISDYALSELETDLHNSVSKLYFRLKLELYNQFLRQIEILKEDLQCKLLDYHKIEEESLFDKVTILNKLDHRFQEHSNALFLNNYVSRVKKIYLTHNENLKESLDQIQEDPKSLESCNTGIRFFPSFKKSKEKKETYWVNNDLGFCEFTTKVLRNSQDMVFHYCHGKNFNVIAPKHWEQKTSPQSKKLFDSILRKLNEIFSVQTKSHNSYEIVFNHPKIDSKKLLNIEVKEFSSEFLKNDLKSNSIFLAFKYLEKYKKGQRIDNSVVVTRDSYKSKLKELRSRSKDFDYSITIDIGTSIGKTENNFENYIAKNFENIFLDNNDPIKNLHKIDRSFLIKPEDTNKSYSVELLNFDDGEKVTKASGREGIIILIAGQIDIRATKDHKEHHVFNMISEDLIKFPCIIPLLNFCNYSFSSSKENPIALLVEECK